LTSPAGTLTKLINAVVTPGGEISKRRSFKLAAIVTGTFGLAATESNLWVFGRNVDPVLPAWPVPGVGLNGAKIPNASTALVQRDYDVFDGYVYLACYDSAVPGTPPDPVLANPHYYLGTRAGTGITGVPAIYDGVETEGSGKGYFIRTFKTKVYSVNGKLLYFSAVGNPMVWDDETLIDSVVVNIAEKTNPIALYVSPADIGQFVAGAYVYTTGVTVAGLTVANGFKKIAAVTPSIVVSGITYGKFTLTGLNGTSATSNQTTGKMFTTPAILVQQISNTNPAVATVAPADIGKFTDGQKVRINGVVGGIVPPPPASNPDANLFIIDSVNNPVNTFRLIGLNASGFAAPQTTDTWATLTTDVVRTGSGWVNLSLTDAASENLQSIEVYYDKLAIFSTQATQIWAVAADPAQNAFDQLLRGSGTTASRSPLQYGSGDVLYLDPSGIRSLKAKDSSNSASVSDIGSPMDPYLQQMKITYGQAKLDEAIALLEPSVGRFWMVFPDEILVLSYFPGPKITAWSTFTLPELGGVAIEYAATAGGRIFLRDKNDRIWTYGAVDPADAADNYNNPGVEIRLPYLDGKKPGHKKTFQAFDATVNGLTPAMASAATGAWRIAVSYDFNNPEQEETIGTITQSTWNFGAHEMQGYDSHFSLRFYNDDEFPATLSNCASHYHIADDEA
jgi:hypothetical protein